MRVKLDDSELRRHVAQMRRAPPDIHKQLWSSLLKVHKDLKTHVKFAMPIDTGRARASWGQFTPGDIRKTLSRTGQPNPASSSDAIEQFDEARLESIQGTRVPYVGRLNAGWSQQAPAGFIDLAEAQAQTKLAAEARRIGLRVI